jgi:threonine dehydrogenase-like Zn-dependent dehydrogenase
MALDLGADRAFMTGPAADEELARICGTQYHQGILGQPYPSGGFSHVYDCVGIGATVKQGLRWTREKGTFVLIGNASKVRDLDLTLVWAKEIRLQGVLGYGQDTYRGERAHTFEWLTRLIGPHVEKAARMVTHSYPLARYPEAVRMALDRSGGRSVKVLFEGV